MCEQTTRPDGKSSGWKIGRMRIPSGIGPMRVADAQAGRPYSKFVNPKLERMFSHNLTPHSD
jgi:hypothetical protein